MPKNTKAPNSLNADGRAFNFNYTAVFIGIVLILVGTSIIIGAFC